MFQLRQIERICAGFERSHRLLQAGGDILRQCHDFAGRFHLRTEFAIRQIEFFKRPARNFNDDVVKRRFKRRFRFAGNGVFDFTERFAERHFRRHFRNRIAGRFGRERRRAAHARIDFDDIVLIRMRIERVLHIAAAFDFQIANNIERRRAQHMMLLIGQRLARRDDDAVTGVDTDRIDIFHITNNDAVVIAVAHDFIFQFFPAGDRAFHQNLVNRTQHQTALTDFAHFRFVVHDAAAGAAQRERRTNDQRVTDRFRKSQRFV